MKKKTERMSAPIYSSDSICNLFSSHLLCLQIDLNIHVFHFRSPFFSTFRVSNIYSSILFKRIGKNDLVFFVTGFHFFRPPPPDLHHITVMSKICSHCLCFRCKHMEEKLRSNKVINNINSISYSLHSRRTP